MTHALENLRDIESWANENDYPVEFRQIPEQGRLVFCVNGTSFSLRFPREVNGRDIFIYSDYKGMLLNIGYTASKSLMFKRFSNIEDVKAEIRNLLNVL